MIRIAICDDENPYLNIMKTSIQNIMQKERIEKYEIDLFPSAKLLEEKIAQKQVYQVIFLDINMPEMSGLELAQKIRESDKDVILIFITAFLDYAIEGYRFNVLRFLLKDMLEQLLPECMDAILRKLQLYTQTVQYRFIEGEIIVPVGDIYYIESRKHKLVFNILNNKNKQLSLYNKLDSIEECLKQYNYIRIHKSFLVNAKYIKSISNYKVTLLNGEQLPVPREKFQKIKEKYYTIKGNLI